MSAIREYFAAPFPWGRFLDPVLTFGIVPACMAAAGAYSAWEHLRVLSLIASGGLVIFLPLNGVLVGVLRVNEEEAHQHIAEMHDYIDLIEPPVRP